ncbi:hypothetical protein [Ferrovibrio terrae]
MSTYDLFALGTFIFAANDKWGSAWCCFAIAILSIITARWA